MIKKTDSYSTELIFKDFYKIPPYQRGYAWSNEQWENLFNDILENDTGYFLGSLICIENEKDDLFEVIDGQQRLTTISILKNALLNSLDNRWTLSVDQRKEIALHTALCQSIFDDDKDKFRLELSIQNNNNEDYEYLCSEKNKIKYEDKVINKPSNFGNRRVSRAFNYFLERLNEKNENEEYLYSANDLFNYLKKLNSALLVRIDVKDLSSAFILFESINNRGIPLTPMDLIKSTVIANVGTNAEATNEKWQTIIDNIEEYSDQIRFLRHYYHAFYNNPQVNLKKYSKASKSDIIHIYETHIKNPNNANYIFEELIEKSKIYTKFIYPEYIKTDDEDVKYQQKLIDLQYLGIAPAYALLLHLFSEYREVDLSNILKMIEKWFIRRHLTDFPATRDLDQIFLKLIKSLEGAKKLEGFEIETYIQKYLFNDNYFSNDEKLTNHLNGNIYDENYSITRYILILLENSKRNEREEKIDFWELKSKNKYLWTVEHILPQNPDDDSDWKELYTDEEQENYVHKLGNLTLTAYNSSLSNSSFNKKLNHKHGFKTGRVKINDYVGFKTEWTKNNIIERTSNMVNDLLEII